MDPEPSNPPSPAPRRARVWLRRSAVGLLALTGIAAGFLSLGVRHEPLATGYPGPAPLPAEVAARFTYPEAGRPVKLHADLEPQEAPSHRSHFVQLPVTTPGDPAPHFVQVRHYAPKAEGRRPAVVVTPIMGGTQEVARIIAVALAEAGLHAAVVLRAERYLDADAEDARLERVLRTAVIDRRRAIDWLQSLPEVDPGHIGAVGVSLGGIVTSLLVSVEPRIRAAVLLMAGGDLATVVATSDEPRVRRYVRERAERGVPPDETRRRIAAALSLDPLRLAPHADARRLLCIHTRFDRAVPYPTQVALWEALGHPERTVLPVGHYTSAVYLPYLKTRVVRFLADRLNPSQAETQ